jgi:hypothetical protein
MKRKQSPGSSSFASPNLRLLIKTQENPRRRDQGSGAGAERVLGAVFVDQRHVASSMTRWRSRPPRYSACSVNYLFLTGEIRPDPSLAGLLHPTAPNRIETCRKGGCQPLRRTQHARRAPVRRRCCQASSTLCRHPRAHLLLRSSQHAWRSWPPRNLGRRAI